MVIKRRPDTTYLVSGVRVKSSEIGSGTKSSYHHSFPTELGKFLRGQQGRDSQLCGPAIRADGQNLMSHRYAGGEFWKFARSIDEKLIHGG